MMTSSIIPTHHTGNQQGITPTLSLQGLHRISARILDHQHGKCSALVIRTDEVGARPLTTHSDRQRVSVLINNNLWRELKGQRLL